LARWQTAAPEANATATASTGHDTFKCLMIHPENE
jgi:hypothetical protein